MTDTPHTPSDEQPCAHESWNVTGEHKTPAGWVKTRKCNECPTSLVPIVEAEPHWDFRPADPAEEQPAQGDVFTEAAVARGALLAGAVVIENLPQDYECDPGRGDAVKVLRRLADQQATAEQPTGPTWEARAAHAVRLYATTAIEREDALADAARLRARVAELEKRDAWLSILEAAGVDSWSGMEHAISMRNDAEDQADPEQPATPTVGAQYVKRTAPDTGRIVTVSRVWEPKPGHTAVAYDWTDDKPGKCGSACPLDVFHRTYRPEAGR
ncbi:hypothetical protein ACIBKZ_09655 [Streptomyces sp. NPDC050421]|uniref:hypothetical protein n=1 Tax=Streptomyces sp. NPDC050421 TaxID=3365613 RepID=UPI00379C11B9